MTATLLVAPMASPAAAGTCTQPYCGGVVRNANSPYYDVAIANCWPDAWSWSKTGAILSCMTNGWRKDKYNAGWWLDYQQTSADIYHYYDTDAFRVGADCIIDVWTGFSTSRWDRRGKDHLWVRITDGNRYSVTYYQCF